MELITDTEAERRVLSAILHSEAARVEAFSAIAEDDFYSPMNRDTLLLTKSLYSRGVRPTYVEVVKEGTALGFLADRNNLEELQHISSQYIDDENINYWCGRVVKAAKSRKAQNLLRRYADEIRKSDLDIDKFIQQAGADFMTLALDNDTEKIENAADIAELGEKTIVETTEKWRKMQEDYKNNDIVPVPLEGVPTGLPRLDTLTLGYKPGDLIILGAQTGHGKTAFALNTSMAAGVDGEKPLLYVNTEMSRKQIAHRWGAILSQVSLQKIRTGSLTDAELTQVRAGFGVFRKSRFFTAYMPNLSPDKLQALARKTKLQHQVEMLVLDYVGRMEKRDPKLQEWQILEDIVKACKIMAQNLEIAVMVLVQLNEDGGLQGAKRMKNECDLMLKLIPVNKEQAEKIGEYHKRQYENFNYRLYVDKSRDSVSGVDIPIVFDKQRQQIREAQVVGNADTWADVGRVIKGGRS